MRVGLGCVPAGRVRAVGATKVPLGRAEEAWCHQLRLVRVRVRVKVRAGVRVGVKVRARARAKAGARARARAKARARARARASGSSACRHSWKGRRSEGVPERG